MASKEGIAQIRSDEGENLKPHLVNGVLHIGIGFNLTREDASAMLIAAGVSPFEVDEYQKIGGKSLTKEQSEALFSATVQEATEIANSVFKLNNVPQEVTDSLTNMAFQLGRTKLSKFNDLRQAVADQDWKAASAAMKDSEWIKQTPNRANRLIKTVGSAKAPTQVVSDEEQDAYLDQLANELAPMVSEDLLIDDLATQLLEAEDAEAAAEVVEPEETTVTDSALQLEKLEDGIYTDDAGDLFEVKANQINRMESDNATGQTNTSTKSPDTTGAS